MVVFKLKLKHLLTNNFKSLLNEYQTTLPPVCHSVICVIYKISLERHYEYNRYIYPLAVVYETIRSYPKINDCYVIMLGNFSN